MTKPIDLSADGISELMGITSKEITIEGAAERQMSEVLPVCPFTPIQGPIDPRKPFGDLESPDLMGSYVTRDDKEIEVLVEIKDYQPEWEGVTLGNCFTPRGEFIDLTPEEQQRMEKEFEKGLSGHIPV